MWISASGYLVISPTAWLRSGSASGLSCAESKSKSTSLGRRSRTGSGRFDSSAPGALNPGASSAKPGSLPAEPLPVAGAPTGAPDWFNPVLELMMSCASLDDVTGAPEAAGSTFAISAEIFAVSLSTMGTAWVRSVAAMTLLGSGTEGVASDGCGVCSALSIWFGSRLNCAGLFDGSATGSCLIGSCCGDFSASGLISICLTVKGPVGGE